MGFVGVVFGFYMVSMLVYFGSDLGFIGVLLCFFGGGSIWAGFGFDFSSICFFWHRLGSYLGFMWVLFVWLMLVLFGFYLFSIWVLVRLAIV